jgi:hypothetical protein
MKHPITNAQLKFNCPVNWDSMEDTVGGKNCDKCQKKVFDLTNCSQDEMDIILIQNNYNICAKFTSQQIAPQPIKLPLWKKWVSAAMILLGINILNNKAIAQTIEVVSGDNMHNSVMPPNLLGEVSIVRYDSIPKFPGGINALNAFLKSNLNFKDSEAEVYLTFDIDTMGKVTRFDVMHGLKSISEEEKAKIVKLSPRWTPAIRGKEKLAISYKLKVTVKQ